VDHEGRPERSQVPYRGQPTKWEQAYAVDHEGRPERSQVPYRGQPTKDNGTGNSGMRLTWPNRTANEYNCPGRLRNH